MSNQDNPKYAPKIAEIEGKTFLLLPEEVDKTNNEHLKIISLMNNLAHSLISHGDKFSNMSIIDSIKAIRMESDYLLSEDVDDKIRLEGLLSISKNSLHSISQNGE